MRKGPATSSASALNPFEGQHDFDAKAPQVPAPHSRRQHLTAAQYWNGPRWKTREYAQYSSTAPDDWSSAGSGHGVMQAAAPDPTASASTYDCYGGGGYYGQYQYQQQYQQQSMSSGSMRICEGATGCGNPSSGPAEQQRRQTRSGFDASGSGGHPKSMMVKHEMDSGDVDGDNFGSIFTKSLTSLYSQDVENAYAEQNDPDIMICEPPTPNAEEAPSYQRLGGSNMYNMNTNPNRGNYGYYDGNRNEGMPAADGSSQMDPKSYRYDRPSFDDMHLYAPNQSATVLTKSQQAKKRKMSMPNLTADGFPSGEARSKKHPKMLSFKSDSKWTPNSCSFAFDQVVVKEEPPDDYPDEGGESTTNNGGMATPVGGKPPSTQSEHPKPAPRKRSPAATCFDRFDKNSSKTSKKVSPLSVYAKVQDSIVLSLKCRRYKKRTKSFTGKEDGHPMNKDEMENWKKTGSFPATEQAVRHVISELLERVSQCGDRHVSELPDFAEIGTHRVRELLYQFCQRYSLDYNDFDELDKVLKPNLVTKTDEPKTSERTIIRKRTSTSPAVEEEEEEVEEEEVKVEQKPPEPVKTPKAPAPVAKKATEPPERRVLRKLPGRKDRGRQKRKRGGKAPAFTRRYSTRSAKDSDNEEAANSEADIIIDSSSDNESVKEEEVICDTKRNTKRPPGIANKSTGNDGVSRQTKKQAQQEPKTSKRKRFEKTKDLQEKPSTKEPPKRTRVNHKSGSDTSQSSASDEKSHSRKEEKRDSSPSSLASNKSQVVGRNEKGKYASISEKSSSQKAPDKLSAKAAEKSSSKSSEKFQVSKAAEKSQVSKTSEKSHAVKASDKSQAAKTSEKVQASKQPEKSQSLRGHEKAGATKTSEKLKTAKPSDKSYISEESEKQHTAESSEKSHKINTSNKSLKVEKSDKSLKTTTTDKSLKIDTSEKSLKNETSDKSINIASSDKSLEINSSDKTLEVNSSDKSLEMSTSKKSLEINASEKSLKINISEKSQKIEMCEDSNKSSKSEKSLNIKTTEKVYTIDTPEKSCVDLSSMRSDTAEHDTIPRELTGEPDVTQTSEITTVIDTLDRSLIHDVTNKSLHKSEPLPITGEDEITEIDKVDETQCVTPTVHLSEIPPSSQISEKKTRDSHVKGKSHGEQVSILAPMMRTHEKLRSSEVTEKPQITELCKQRLQTATEHSQIELEPGKSQLTTLLKKQADNSSNHEFDTSSSAGSTDTFLRSDSYKMDVPPKCTIQRPIPIYRNRPPLDAVADSPPFLRKMEISDPKLQIRGKLSNWRVSLEDIMAKDPLRSHAHLSAAKKIPEEVPRYTPLNVPNPFEAKNLDGGNTDTGKRDLLPPIIDINSSENSPRGFTPPRTERKEFLGHPEDLRAEAFYNGPSPILSNELHKKDFLPYPPGTQRTTTSEFYQTPPPKSIGSFGIFETGAFEAVSLTKKTFDGVVRGSKSPAKEDESSSTAFDAHKEVEEPIYLGKPPELVLVKDIKKEFMEEAKCEDVSRRRSSSAGSKGSEMPRIAHFAMKRERRKASAKRRDPAEAGRGRSACSESDDSDGGLVIDLERGQALDDKTGPGSVPKKEPKSEPTGAAPADPPVVPAAVKKEEEGGGTSRAWDEEDDDCVILTEEAAAAKKSSSEKALKDDESILRTLLLETGEVLNGSSSSQDNVGPSSQQGDHSNSFPDIDSKTTIGQEVMKLLYQSYHDASNSSSSPGFSDDKKPIEKLSPGGCSPHEESISMEEDRTDWSTRDPRQLKEKIKKLKNEIVYLQCMADQKDKERTAIVCFKKYKEEVLRRLVKEYTYNVQGHFRDWIRSKHDKAENRSPSFRDSPPALRQQGGEPQASIPQPRPAHSRPPLTMYHPVPKQEDQQPPAAGPGSSSCRSPSQQPQTHYGGGGEKLPTVETLIAKATENYGVDMRTMRGSSSAAGSPPASAATQTILKKVLSSKESFSPTHSLSPSLMDSMRSKLATSQPLQLVTKPYPKQYGPVDLINKPPRSSADPSATFNAKAIPKLYDTAKASAMYQYPPGFDNRPKSCKPYDVPKLLASCEYQSPFESRASSKPYDIPKPMGAAKGDYPMVYEGGRTSSKPHDLPSKAKLEYPHGSYDHHRASSKPHVSKPGHPYEYPPTFDSRSAATSKSYESATKPGSCDYSTFDATRSPHHQQSKSMKPGNDSYAKDRGKHTSHHPGSPSYWSIQAGAKVASDPGRPSDALKMERSNPVRAHSESSLGKRGQSGHAFSSQPLKLSSLMKPDPHHERSLKSSVERLYNRKTEEERRGMAFQPHPAPPAQPGKGVGAAPPPFLPATHLPQPLEPLPRGNPTCNRCGQPDATFLCSGCRKHWYCSPHCQTMLWPDHSRSCAGAINSTPPL